MVPCDSIRCFLQPCNRLSIRVVGRLAEQQPYRRSSRQLAQRRRGPTLSPEGSSASPSVRRASAALPSPTSQLAAQDPGVLRTVVSSSCEVRHPRRRSRRSSSRPTRYSEAKDTYLTLATPGSMTLCRARVNLIRSSVALGRSDSHLRRPSPPQGLAGEILVERPVFQIRWTCRPVDTVRHRSWTATGQEA